MACQFCIKVFRINFYIEQFFIERIISSVQVMWITLYIYMYIFLSLWRKKESRFSVSLTIYRYWREFCEIIAALVASYFKFQILQKPQ